MSDNCCLVDTMTRHIGQTVTVFTVGGGLAGNGFTGVLSGICNNAVKLITDIGAPPACPVGSMCSADYVEPATAGRSGISWRSGCGCGGGLSRGGYNWLGSVTEIPIDKICSFTHTAL
jgi:hypothetical protein